LPTIDDIIRKNAVTGRGLDAAGKPRPLTAREFFDVSVELGLNQHNPEYRQLFETLAFWMRLNLPGVRSTLEIGAGPGYLIHCLAQLGIDSQGIDGNPFSREYFAQCHPQSAQRYAIDAEFSGDYGPRDAVLAIEVFEHIPDPYLHTIMEKLRHKVCPKFVVFSSTPYPDPHEGWDLQWGHINLKSGAQWDAFFAQWGYLRAAIRPPVTEWAALYVDRNVVASMQNPQRGGDGH
jgi:2-polyprenyl-3-methyl-5-hydroxy-6-metoxy-1,4-benzoquinol methylase